MKWLTLKRLLAVSLALGAVACSSTGTSNTPVDTDAGSHPSDGGGGLPELHRPVATSCPSTRPPGLTPGNIPGAPCAKDDDCTQGTNGRCIYDPSFKPVCSYDQCASDSQCGTGICECRNEPSGKANVCVRGNCVTDADCPGSYCSPSALLIPSNCRSKVAPGSFGYFCHTPEDECINAAECGSSFSGACVFVPEKAHFQCAALVCTK